MMGVMVETVAMANMVQDVFRRAVASKRAFLMVAERCAIKGWPDRKIALRNAFRLQELLGTREELRFEYLTGTYASEEESRMFPQILGFNQNYSHFERH
jgi:hypothetical protein